MRSCRACGIVKTWKVVNELPAAEAQVRTVDYDSLARAIAEAGFYTTPVEELGTWHRISICSKRRPNGGFIGNSFWASHFASGWFLGTWGGCLYRLPDDSRLAELCIAWLSRVPDGTRADFDDRLKTEFELLPIPDEVFHRESGMG